MEGRYPNDFEAGMAAWEADDQAAEARTWTVVYDDGTGTRVGGFEAEAEAAEWLARSTRPGHVV
jgi:hypothetical protein